MVLSMGAATRNVRGGRFRSTIRGFLAQVPNRNTVIPAKAIRARDQEYLRKDIQISPRRWIYRQVTSGTGSWGPDQAIKGPRGLSTDFVRENEKGRRKPAALSRYSVLTADRLPNDGDLEAVQALAAVAVLHLHEVHATGEVPAVARFAVPVNFVDTLRGVLRDRLHETASDVEDPHVSPTGLRRREANDRRRVERVREVPVEAIQTRSTRDRSNARRGQVAVLDGVERSVSARLEAGQDCPVAVLVRIRRARPASGRIRRRPWSAAAREELVEHLSAVIEQVLATLANELDREAVAQGLVPVVIVESVAVGAFRHTRDVRHAGDGRIESRVLRFSGTGLGQSIEPVRSRARTVDLVGVVARDAEGRAGRGIREQIANRRENHRAATVPLIRRDRDAEDVGRQRILVRVRHAAHGKQGAEVIVSRSEDAAVTTIGARGRLLPPLLDQLRVGLFIDHRGRGVRGLDHDPVPAGQRVLDAVLVHIREVVAQPAGAGSCELVTADVTALFQTLQRTIAIRANAHQLERLHRRVRAEIPARVAAVQIEERGVGPARNQRTV